MANNGTSYAGCYFLLTAEIALNNNVLNSDSSLASGTFMSWTPTSTSPAHN